MGAGARQASGRWVLALLAATGCAAAPEFPQSVELLGGLTRVEVQLERAP